MPRTRVIRVVTADHNQMACQLLSEALSRQPGIAVVGSATDYASFVRQVQLFKPDLALVSAALPGGPLRSRPGTDSEAQMASQCPWVALLDESSPEAVVAAFRAGAKGVFSRAQADVRLLAKCIRRVTEGQVWVDSQQMHYLLDAFTEKGAGANHACNPPRLTRREESVVRLVVQGMANREIADRLRLSEHTIKNYLFRVFDKLGVSNRVELALYAVARLNLGEEVAA